MECNSLPLRPQDVVRLLESRRAGSLVTLSQQIRALE
jgi:hypothetical protein